MNSKRHRIAILIIFELLFNLAIIYRVPYTEIDFSTYMQQVEKVWNGEREYSKIYGDSGPLVYPAGFLYSFGIFYVAGLSKILVQIGFAGIYILNLILVLKIYEHSSSKVPIILFSLSKRIHSIYVLRCFNDPVAMLFLYASILCLLKSKYNMSTILFSLALSIKMNVLLYFPGFALILWKCEGAFLTFRHIIRMIGIQLFLAAPFILTYPKSYFTKAFDFQRQFEYIWSVNWKIVNEDVFASKEFSRTLLLGHLTILLIFVQIWCKSSGGIWNTFKRGFHGSNGQSIPTADEIIFALFSSNFVGILFARSLHFQFYSWYYHTIPYLLWNCSFTNKKYGNLFIRMVLFFTIEYCWNVFPSNQQSSSLLLYSHLTLLLFIIATKQ
eukprot:NODE_11_length_54881_cov_1.430718.p18 type:complete len:384 gc:universal NODE_11_length_54881_cov_1.430718:39559-38408(-)